MSVNKLNDSGTCLILALPWGAPRESLGLILIIDPTGEVMAQLAGVGRILGRAACVRKAVFQTAEFKLMGAPHVCSSLAS